MIRQATDYLAPPPQFTNRIRERRHELARRRRSSDYEPGTSTATLATGAAALSLLVLAGYYFGPDLVRYLKLRRM